MIKGIAVFLAGVQLSSKLFCFKISKPQNLLNLHRQGSTTLKIPGKPYNPDPFFFTL